MDAFTDHHSDPASWAQTLGISSEAVELYLASDVIDLHIDSFIWHRVFGYDLRRRHGPGFFRANMFSQVDFPRALEANLTGAIWVITTNPLKGGESRRETFLGNLLELEELFASVSERFELVRDAASYERVRSAGKHAAFIGIQGGNALDHDRFTLNLLDGKVVRITLVHLSSSTLGTTSSPLKLGEDAGLSEQGRDYVRQLDEKRVFVDLAHISKRGFWDAVDVHDHSLPLIVTHTGVSGVHEHWRNLDDAQLRAIAESGGTIGIMYHWPFLGPGARTQGIEAIVRHLEHIVRTVGEDYASLGSDWDGAILTPRDMPTCLELPRLVQAMLDRDWQPERIRKILGQNFLRSLKLLRG
ncbi:MAG TPA: membrane dipeptidase [Polyangiaceae bacterium]|nr:membrane dipeptidase [Polyangiaceae bacterium]